MPDPGAVILLALVAGALSLDMTAAFQVMLSQPLVAATIAGAIVGNLPLGLAVGATLQLVWVGVLPVGAAPFPDTAVAGVVGAGLAGLLARTGVTAGWAAAGGILVALVAGYVGQRLVGVLRRANTRFADMARVAADRGDPGGIRRAIALALASRFAAGAGLAFVFLGVASSGLRFLPHGPGSAYPMAVWAAPIAAGGALAVARRNIQWVLLGAGFLAGLAFVVTR